MSNGVYVKKNGEWINTTGGSDVTVDSELSSTSENPVQNKVITEVLGGKADKSEIPDVSGYLPLTGGTVSDKIIISGSNPHLGLRDTSGSEAYLQTYNDGSGLKAGFGYGWTNSLKLDSSGNIHGPASIYQNGKQVANKEDIPNTSKMMTTDTAQTITGSKAFTGTVGNTQSSPGVYLGLDTNSAPNANMAIVSANSAAYIDMGAPNEDYGFRIIKWKGTSGDVAQFTYGGGGTITVPNATGTIALTSQIPSVPKITMSTSDPSGGSNGDIWFKYA